MQFDLAGIDVQMDTTDPDDGRISRNIIHQFVCQIDQKFRELQKGSVLTRP